MSDGLVWLIVILPIFDWIVAGILGVIAFRYPYILTLRERFVTALMLSGGATIAAVLGFVRFGILTLGNDEAILLLCIALILASVPAVVWLFLLVTGRFRLPPDTEGDA